MNRLIDTSTMKVLKRSTLRSADGQWPANNLVLFKYPFIIQIGHGSERDDGCTVHIVFLFNGERGLNAN